MKQSYRRSPLALTVLALLYEAPMHAYRMQQLIKERGKDEVVNVRQRTSIYQTIERLERDGLVAVRETLRDEKWPERTVYELTAEGRRIFPLWLRDMLATPLAEFPEFPVAIAFLPLLAPDDALCQLERRAAVLRDEIARLAAQLHGPGQAMPRLFMLETEYLHGILSTELEWVRRLITDLRSGALTWSDEWLQQFQPPPEAGDPPP